MRNCVTVSLGSELHEFAERVLTSGRKGNPNGSVRAGPRPLDERDLKRINHRNHVRSSKYL